MDLRYVVSPEKRKLQREINGAHAHQTLIAFRPKEKKADRRPKPLIVKKQQVIK